MAECVRRHGQGSREQIRRKLRRAKNMKMKATKIVSKVGGLIDVNSHVESCCPKNRC